MIPFVEWQDHYSVGDPSLDAQHRQIIALVNEMYEGMQQHKGRAVLTGILDRLLEYTLTHFKYEEQVMREHGFPDLAQHAAVHARMQKRTEDLREHVHLVTGHDLLRFLKEWWVEHIQGIDRKYAPYMQRAASRGSDAGGKSSPAAYEPNQPRTVSIR